MCQKLESSDLIDFMSSCYKVNKQVLNLDCQRMLSGWDDLSPEK